MDDGDKTDNFGRGLWDPPLSKLFQAAGVGDDFGRVIDVVVSVEFGWGFVAVDAVGGGFGDRMHHCC